MNKFELAIRKTANKGIHSASIFARSGASSIDQIKKMSSNFLLSNELLIQKKIIYPRMSDNELLNSFRELRSSITVGDNHNVIMVTALDTKSGTSFFARNLASVIAFDTSRTSILMDCNALNDAISGIFNIHRAKGLSDYVSSPDLSCNDIIYETGISRLRVVPFGDKNTGIDEQFSHPRFHDLLTEIKHKYIDRDVIIDAPPILNSADARILLELCDQVIVVVPYGKVNRSRLEEAAYLVGLDRLSGVVFNDYFNN
jgi:protein-tyrosine kinase